ncbi:MAG TPA: hypothetical protein V6D08_06315 [Candidatus Obscuribacterales bacterium]
MTPDIYSFLRAKIERIAAAGGDAEEAMQCARRYLELERGARAPGRAAVESIGSRPGRRPMQVVKT